MSKLYIALPMFALVCFGVSLLVSSIIVSDGLVVVALIACVAEIYVHFALSRAYDPYRDPNHSSGVRD